MALIIYVKISSSAIHYFTARVTTVYIVPFDFGFVSLMMQYAKLQQYYYQDDTLRYKTKIETHSVDVTTSYRLVYIKLKAKSHKETERKEE